MRVERNGPSGLVRNPTDLRLLQMPTGLVSKWTDRCGPSSPPVRSVRFETGPASEFGMGLNHACESAGWMRVGRALLVHVTPEFAQRPVTALWMQEWTTSNSKRAVRY